MAIDGRTVLRPRDEVNVTSVVEVRRSGVYRYEFRVAGGLNLTAVYAMRANVISVGVEISIFSPEVRRAWPRPNGTDETSLVLNSRETTLKWGYVVYTDATRRSITIKVGDPQSGYTRRLGPGEKISQNLTTAVKAPGDVALWVEANSTAYRLDVALALARPKIVVDQINEVEFKDERALLGLRITCTIEGITVPIVFDILRVAGVVEHGSGVRTGSGSVVVRSAAGTHTGTSSGRLEGSRGRVTIRASGEEIHIEFATPPLAITKILRGGRPVSCNVPVELVPALLGVPTTRGEEDAGECVYGLFTALAKEGSEVPQSIVWNGEYFEVTDRRGYRYRVYVESLVVQGALEATLVIS